MLSDELDKLVKEQERTVTEMVANLEGELLKRTPVATGDLKGAWDVNKTSKGGWIFTNNMDYADVIMRGRRQVPTSLGNMKWVGSEQLKDGIYPILDEFEKELDKRLAKLKA